MVNCKEWRAPCAGGERFDRNLSFQQNLPVFDIAVIVLRSGSNRLAPLRSLVPDLLAAIPAAKRGVATFIGV
jgi:hypothetical protein